MSPPDRRTAASWQEYLAAARSLGAVRRTAARAAATSAGTARAELALLQARLERQHAEMASEAVRSGRTGVRLAVSPAEQAAADTLVTRHSAAVAAVVRHCRHLVELADAQLDGGPPSNRVRRSHRRGFALVAGLLLARHRRGPDPGGAADAPPGSGP